MTESFEAPQDNASEKVRFQPGVRVDTTTLARGSLRLHIIECNLCGPVGVDFSNREDQYVALDHLREAHTLPVVPA